MFRILVATYLMIVAVVGPAACCCTLTRLLTRFLPTTSCAPSSAPSCCQHLPAGKDSMDDTDQEIPSDLPGKSNCPCKESGQGEVVVLPTAQDQARESLARLSSALLTFYLALPIDSVLDWTAASAVYRQGVSDPPLSTDDLLYVFHILRC